MNQRKTSKRARVNTERSKRRWLAYGAIVMAAIVSVIAYRQMSPGRADARVAPPASAVASTPPPAANASFAATEPNASPGPAKTPRGMAWIPGGEFSMGAQDPPDMDEVGMK